MHYKNGRKAQAGDRVINLTTGETGIIHSLTAESDRCNARMTRLAEGQYVTIGECILLEDIIFKQVDSDQSQ